MHRVTFSLLKKVQHNHALTLVYNFLFGQTKCFFFSPVVLSWMPSSPSPSSPSVPVSKPQSLFSWLSCGGKMFGLLLSEMKFLRRATLNGESFFLFFPAALPCDPKTFLELGTILFSWVGSHFLFPHFTLRARLSLTRTSRGVKFSDEMQTNSVPWYGNSPAARQLEPWSRELFFFRENCLCICWMGRSRCSDREFRPRFDVGRVAFIGSIQSSLSALRDA